MTPRGAAPGSRTRAVVAGLGRHLVRLVVALVLPTGMVVLWWLVTRARSSVYFPPPSAIWTVLVHQWWHGGIRENVVPSVEALFAGWAISVAGGVVLGVLLYEIRWLEAMFDPVMHFLRSLPAVALAPASLVILGLGIRSTIGLIAFAAIWVVLLNVLDGLKALDVERLAVARAFRVRGRQNLLGVKLAGALPQILAGVRTSLQVALILMVASELVGATSGIGYAILNSERSYDMPDMWAGMIVLGVLGVVVNAAFSLLERWMLRPYGLQRIGDAR